jgi:predicted O-linked N-acetylglucosamine transferase (SPINDLY family)
MSESKLRRSLSLAENCFRSGNYKFSEQILNSILRTAPSHAKANELLAYIYGNKGDSDTSFRLLELSCSKDDCSPEALYYLGSAQLKKSLYEKAARSFERSILKAGRFFEALHDLGTAYGHMGKIQESLSCFQDCLKFNPKSHELLFNIGKCFSDLQHHPNALTCYTQALQLKPDFIEAYTSIGITLNKLRRYDEAIAHYDKVISLKADCVEALSNKGISLNELQRYDEAIAHYDKAISLKPDIDWIPGDLLHTKMRICDWSGLDDSLKKVSAKVITNEKVSPPFALLALTDDAVLHQQSAKIYAQDQYPPNPALGPILKHPRGHKIRIGYFSADFKNHPVANLTVELFELHNKNRFEVFAFSFGVDDKSPVRLRLSQAFDQFIDVSGMSDLGIAKLSRDMQIDIAIDLGGYTADSRTGIFSHRAAPIQVSYIGYLGTMGADYIDYIIADKTLIPTGSQSYYSEKVVYLPNSYQVNDRKRLISDKQFTRKELGLPENSFVFCCFNNNYKILPATFDGWMRILKGVEGSVLFLYAENAWAKSNLKLEAEARGINSKRLVFGGYMPNAAYLARYQACDLFLDTFSYNAGTTASDALWAGLPILTLMGQSFASRVAASLLNAIGLPELITNTQEEYEALAIELAMNPEKLAAIKLRLVNNRQTTSLFDSPLFAKNLEAAYIKMFELYQADFLPEHISII